MTPTKILSFKIIRGIIYLNIFVTILLLLINKFTTSICLGLLFGSIFSILNFRLLAISIEKSVLMLPHKAQGYMVSKYFLRMFLTSVVIIISLKSKNINVIGTLIGLILPSLYIKISSLLLNICSTIKKRKEA